VKVVTQDPAEKLDYEFEFASDLPDGDTVVTQTVVADDADVAVTDVARTGTLVVGWVEGGTMGTTVQLKCTVTTAQGRRFVRRTSLLMRPR
jgi:hypothetical protein